jgi:hypothetical protein
MLIAYVQYCLKDAIRHCASLVRVASFHVVSALSVAILSLYFGGCKPPDLSPCTRLEVQYADGALNYFFPHSAWQETVLNEEERALVRSHDIWTVTDREQIRAFACVISQGTYSGRMGGKPKDPGTDVVCWRDRERVTSFIVCRTSILTADKSEFKYSTAVPILSVLDPPRLKSLQARWKCGRNLSALIYEGLWPGPGPRPHLDPNHWCDSVVDAYRSLHVFHDDLDNKKERMYPDAAVARRFLCPSVHSHPDVNDARSQDDGSNSSSQTADTWTSDYAMNPNCRGREESPRDMVFLFESKPGWNQHGGPELFRFDNHDPKGGLVLLNDGTVKFIRTEEELKQLRWK